MRVLKITAEGLTTSFRYPHFMQQIHPSFQMPPPTTIYGHICSAVGQWVDPEGLKFAYHFTHQGLATDIEHIIVLSRGKGKLPGTKYPKVLEGKVNPFDREIFFNPRLTLYLNRPEWEPFFRSPHYAVVLGRSQDLFTYTEVSVIELRQAAEAYFEHTLLPYHMALQVMQGIAVTMPRYLDYENNRSPVFDRYLVVKDRIYSKTFYNDVAPYWTDPTSPAPKGINLGLTFHTFTEET